MNPPIVSTKETLRQALRLRREEITPEQYAARSVEIASHLLKFLAPFDTILVYASKPPEVDTRPLITALLEEGKHVMVPIIQREDCSLRFSYIRTLMCWCRARSMCPNHSGMKSRQTRQK